MSLGGRQVGAAPVYAVGTGGGPGVNGRLPMPKGVPRLPGLPGADGPKGAGVGIVLALAAAGLTAAAGFAADRLNRDRRIALALDETLTIDPFHEEADEEHTVHTSDGVALHVEVDHARDAELDGADGSAGHPGVRPTIVLCHGYCLSLRSWVFQRRGLRDAGYRVVLWDHRGHGRSGTGDPGSYHVDRLGSDLYQVLCEVVPDGPLVLVGHSMGGMTIMGLALDHPKVVRDRVVGVAFVATSPGNLAGTTYGMGMLGKVVNRLVTPTTVLLSGRQGLVDGTVKIGRDIVDLLVDFGSFGSPVPLSIARLTTDMIFGTRMDVISAFMPRFDELDKREALAHFDGIESLVLTGMQDRLTPPEHSDEIVRLLPGAEDIVVADAGHVIMLEHPDVLNDQLLALAERATRAASARDVQARREKRGHVTSVRRTLTDMSSMRRATQARRRVDTAHRHRRAHGGSRPETDQT